MLWAVLGTTVVCHSIQKTFFEDMLSVHWFLRSLNRNFIIVEQRIVLKAQNKRNRKGR